MSEQTILVTVSDDRSGRKEGLYSATQDKIQYIFTKNNFGIKHIQCLKWADISDSTFFNNNKTLLSNIDPAKNGRAYKPYAILESMKIASHGDYIIYTDCSPEMWNMHEDFIIDPAYNIEVIKKLCRNNNNILSAFVKWDTRNIPSGGLGIHTHENFTTNRCIDKMGLRQYEKCFMHASGMLVFRKTPETISFLEEWLYWNCIDECASLGKANIETDYSFWDNEECLYKMGHRHDQSISGLLINKMGNKLIDIVYNSNGLHHYNFLNFCHQYIDYNFIDPNYNPDTKRRIKKGDTVTNSAGQEMIVFEIRPENNIEWLIIGPHRESCYRTTEDKLTW